jgi:hypothetical protein
MEASKDGAPRRSFKEEEAENAEAYAEDEIERVETDMRVKVQCLPEMEDRQMDEIETVAGLAQDDKPRVADDAGRPEIVEGENGDQRAVDRDEDAVAEHRFRDEFEVHGYESATYQKYQGGKEEDLAVGGYSLAGNR